MPLNKGAALVLQQTLAWLQEERPMQEDRARLAQACCSPAKFVALQGAPLPSVV
jgi:ArsR family transcriptional regulator